MFYNRNIKKENAERGSFVGTPLYLAPEMLEHNDSGLYTDYWAVGCIIYEMLCGSSPFKDDGGAFKNVMERSFKIPVGMDPVARDLVEKLI